MHLEKSVVVEFYQKVRLFYVHIHIFQKQVIYIITHIATYNTYSKLNGLANEETARLIKMSKGDVYAYQVDLTKKEDVYRVADLVKKQVGKVSFNQ